MRQWGPAGMPDAIRTTVESLGAHPHRGGFRAAISTVFVGLPFETSLAQESAAPFEAWTIKPYLAALLLLDRHEIAALALTLGILAFAVVTAILLVCTRGRLVRPRRRLAALAAAARDQSFASRAAMDHVYALLLSEPQILIAWPASSEEPEIIGDPTLVVQSDHSGDVLAFARS